MNPTTLKLRRTCSLKKRLLPLLLATCIGAGTVSTCDAGWDFWNNATVKTCVTNCLAKLGFLKNKKVQIIGGMVVGVLAIYCFSSVIYKRFMRPYSAIKKEWDISGLEQACRDGDIEKIKEILHRNRWCKDLDNWILFGKGDVQPGEIIGKNSPLYLASLHGLDAVKPLMEKLNENVRNKEQKLEKINFFPLFRLIADNSIYAREILNNFYREYDVFILVNAGDGLLLVMGEVGADKLFDKDYNNEGSKISLDSSIAEIKSKFDLLDQNYKKIMFLNDLFDHYKSREDMLSVEDKKYFCERIEFKEFILRPKFRGILKFLAGDSSRSKNKIEVETIRDKNGESIFQAIGKHAQFDKRVIFDPGFNVLVQIAIENKINDKDGKSVLDAICEYGDPNDYLAQIFEHDFCIKNLFIGWHNRNKMGAEEKAAELEKLTENEKLFSRKLDDLYRKKGKQKLFVAFENGSFNIDRFADIELLPIEVAGKINSFVGTNFVKAS